MSEVEGTEELNDENTVQAPAEELVELILTGELHAANQKFNSIIEDKVIESIEEEKHKISQTLFAEDEEEADEGKIPPQFLKGKDKDDDDDSDDDDDDDSDDDDSDSDDSDDDDDDDDSKSKKGKVPPQFAKKDEAVEPTEEGITGDPEANEKAIAHNRAMAKKYGQVRQGIPPEKEKKEEVEPVDELSAQTAQNAEIKARMAGPDKRKERQAGKFAQYGQSKAQGGRGIDVRNKTMNQTGPVKKKSYFDTEQAVDEISSATADAAAQKAYNDIRDNPSSQKPTLGTTKTAKSDAKRKRQADKFDAYRDSKDFDKKGSKKGGAAKAAGKMGKKSDQQRHTDWRDNPDDQNQGHYVSNSFDPGEASSNVELPMDSFVQQVADNLAGKRR